jgi:hypothetical protein
MKNKTQTRVLGLLVTGCILAAGVAQAEISIGALGTTDSKIEHQAIPMYKYARPNITQINVKDSGSGTLNTKTYIDGWVYYDTKTCKQIGVPHLFDVPATDKVGVWGNGFATGHLGNGTCPNVTFNFTVIYFTWTNSHSKVGAVETQTVTAIFTRIPKKYGVGKAVELVDSVTYTLK